MRRIAAIVVCACVGGLAAAGKAQKTLFYMQQNAAGVHSFEAHKDKIDILVPIWYAVNGHGLVTGEPDRRVLSGAKAAHVQVIPIVVLFDKQQLHELFNDVKAQEVMNRALVDNAILGPWIHVGSKMQLLSAAKVGDEIAVRAKVTGNYDKKGHRFVELDALVVANGTTPLAHCWHIAIYQPREQAAA